jgi:hypothetical protein
MFIRQHPVYKYNTKLTCMCMVMVLAKCIHGFYSVMQDSFYTHIYALQYGTILYTVLGDASTNPTGLTIGHYVCVRAVSINSTGISTLSTNFSANTSCVYVVHTCYD